MPIPKGWKKTPYQKAELWSQIELRATRLATWAKKQDLAVVTTELPYIRKLTKQIERAQVADALEK